MRDLVVINPGTGPIENSVPWHAERNIRQFNLDLRLLQTVNYEWWYTPKENGRYPFTLWTTSGKCEIDMPGIPLEDVRWIDAEGQNIWHYPRLYVDGSSFVWKYAVELARDKLRGITGDDYVAEGE